MEKFKEALQNCDTVKVILTGVGETEFSTKELYESIQELERLAEIGKATEKAFNYTPKNYYQYNVFSLGAFQEEEDFSFYLI
jgi:hypothetical protein